MNDQEPKPVNQEIDDSNLPAPSLGPSKGIDINQIIRLRRKNLSLSQIATLLGCSKPNVVQRLNSIGYHIDRLDDFKAAKADRFELELSKLIDSITDADRKKASYYNKILSAGILIDKIQLLTGKPTSFVAYADVIKARDFHKATLEDMENVYKQRKNGSDGDSEVIDIIED